MASHTYLCLPCRWSRRAPAAYGLVTNYKCRSCGASLWELDKRWRIPKKTDDKGWLLLQEKVARDSAEWLKRRLAMGKAKIARIDHRIESLKKAPVNSRKQISVRRLRTERAKVQRSHAVPDYEL